MKTKQVIVMRTDLNMRKGKMSAQASHASMGVFTRRMEPIKKSIWLVLSKFFLKLGGYDIKLLYSCDFSPEMLHWLDSSYAKIVVGGDSESVLFDLENKAALAGIPYSLIKDNGQTEFKEICHNCGGDGCAVCNGTGKINKPTYTCIALGPDNVDKIDALTKELQLL